MARKYILIKPSTDIVMVGEACATDKRPVTQLDVSLAVADLRKTIRVFGDRRWDAGLLGLHMTPPIPFESMPLIYERAFGGFHEVSPEKTLYEPRNPIGTGFKGKRSNKEFTDTMLPNLEDPADLIKKIRGQADAVMLWLHFIFMDAESLVCRNLR